MWLKTVGRFNRGNNFREITITVNYNIKIPLDSSNNRLYNFNISLNLSDKEVGKMKVTLSSEGSILSFVILINKPISPPLRKIHVF